MTLEFGLCLITLFVMAGQFLYPADGATKGWRFVTTIDRLPVGESMSFVAPSGAKARSIAKPFPDIAPISGR